MLVILFTVALLLSLAVPSPAQGVDNATIDRFNIFAQYAAAAGCDQNNNSTDSPIVTCDYGCPLLTDFNVTTLYEFQNKGWADVTGYLALDKSRKLLVLAFRGSVSSSNWRDDLVALPIPVPSLCLNCWVHEGFHAAWNSVRRSVVGVLDDALAAHSDYQLVFTGHSLGGAIATMAATRLRDENRWGGRDIQLYTFGAPIIGNKHTAVKTTTLVSIFRATHQDDAVPRLPFRLWPPFDYTQPSPEYWIISDNGEPVTVDDVVYIEGSGSEQGNLGTTGNDTSKHMWYFSNMTVCAAPEDRCQGWGCIFGNWVPY
ncbi:lipase family protein [Aspergillus stella-maris]|uniref:lipase family protein n=1 Tax=Aspergillus stella-maris TaxID=1810926 RepID=UPI003CCDB8DF